MEGYFFQFFAYPEKLYATDYFDSEEKALNALNNFTVVDNSLTRVEVLAQENKSCAMEESELDESLRRTFKADDFGNNDTLENEKTENETAEKFKAASFMRILSRKLFNSKTAYLLAIVFNVAYIILLTFIVFIYVLKV